MSLHPGLVKRIDTLNRSFSLIDQYSVVLQIQVHTVVWLVKKSIHRYSVIFAAGTSAREQDAVAESLPQLISSQSSAPLKSPAVHQILQD